MFVVLPLSFVIDERSNEAERFWHVTAPGVRSSLKCNAVFVPNYKRIFGRSSPTSPEGAVT